MKFLLLSWMILSCASLEAITQPEDNNFRRELHKKLKQNHKPLSYKAARQRLFGAIHLEGTNPGNYVVRDIYCTTDFTTKDFPPDKTIGPGKIPYHLVINAEHVWPQSRFGRNDGRDDEKEFKVSDLHILYPSDSRLNSARSNHKYGIVKKPTRTYPCSDAKLGKYQDITIFEPPKESKGNVARSTFYFAIRYNKTIDAREEAVLRRWHEEDPVDRMEVRRNKMIERYQGNRNPFIDAPEIINRIRDI